MSELKLISVDVLYNCAEPGDSIYITAKWENCGEKPNFNAQIAADMVFCGRQRRDETQADNFRLLWYPFPNTNNWKKGDVWETTGVWKVPVTWGGTFELNISLIGESGEAIKFIGKNSAKTFCQKITEIEVAWGYGRNRMIKQRKALTVEINPLAEYWENSNTEYVTLNNFKFCKLYPAVVGYENSLWNDFEPVLTLRKITDNSKYVFVGNSKVNYKFHEFSDRIIYSALCEFCSFDMLFSFEKGHLEIELNNVRECPDYELLSFEITSLAQMSEKDSVFTNFYGGGRIAKLSDALMQTVEFYYDTCNLIAVSSAKGSFCLEAEDVENILCQSVIKSNSKKSVCLSAKIRNKIEAKAVGMKSIPVRLKPLKLWYSKKADWQISGEIIKNRLNKKYPVLYKDTLMYKIMLDASGQYTPDNPARYVYSKITTLADAEKMIMSIYHLSHGMHQVVYLVGWQTGGHDFSYPYPYKLPFNSKVGTAEEFNALRKKLKSYNVELSLHDNFDDAYLSDEYEINQNNLCRDEYGNLWKGWMWAGGMSYIIDPKAYTESSEVEERINTMLSDYGIENTYHLDVLTSEVRRYNFEQNRLTAAEDGINAKLKIIDLFNEKGVDITSETLAMPFIGKIGYSQNTRYRFNSSLFYGDELAPLTTIAFHGTTPYKFSSSGSKESLLRSIAVGGACSLEVEGESNETSISRNIYLSTIPMSKLAYSRVLNANVCDNKWIIEYENGRVAVDFAKCEYKVEFNNRVISENFTTFVQISENEYCYYSIDGGNAKLNIHDYYGKLSVNEISKEGIVETTFVNCTEKYEFISKADTPYIIKRVI